MSQILSNKQDNINIVEIFDEYTQIQQYLLQLMLSSVTQTEKPKENPSQYEGDLVYEIDRMRTASSAALWSSNQYPWGKSKWSMFYQNDVMRKIMSVETEQAFESMNETVEEMAEIKNGKYKQTTNDITIHIRCGDIISHGVPYNGFQTMNFFKNARNVIQKRLNTSNTNANVYVLMNILDTQESWSQKNSHSGTKLEDHRKCRIYSNHLMKEFRNNIFNKYKNVILISDGTMHLDYYTMMHSANMVCGLSTFCVAAALCNTHANTIIFPDTFNNVHDFIPKGIVLVKNSWISSQQFKKQNLTISELAQFVNEH
eukprot:33317_1